MYETRLKHRRRPRRPQALGAKEAKERRREVCGVLAQGRSNKSTFRLMGSSARSMGNALQRFTELADILKDGKRQVESRRVETRAFLFGRHEARDMVIVIATWARPLKLNRLGPWVASYISPLLPR